eukprot:CAMPEP_0194333224 /NCGR_PEP_ID=MMETSP0171-20130528/62002_1 /TAXON_ID=218684 /ORGANISM="Corethron pennatum, Strain L29A3" /LENGTH=181 /DNA_ID=CAMNT_0039095373 /DNA_START=8 /DNA_END=549 /DNA_ORIENTATION=+
MSEDAGSNRGSDDDEADYVPRGILQKSRVRGWEGYDMELTRTCHEGGGKSRSAAVDKHQFYNNEVGVGYQARGVVRQKRAVDDAYKIFDMSKPAEEDLIDIRGGRKGVEDHIIDPSDERNKYAKQEKKKRKKEGGRPRRSERKGRKGRKEKKKNAGFNIDIYFSNPLFLEFRKELSRVLEA